MATKQSRQHSIVCYDVSTVSIIEKIPQFEHVTYICHNSDIDSDGNLKKKHYHVLVRSKSSKTSTAIQKIINNELLKTDSNYFNRPLHDSIFAEFVHDTVSVIDYLTHKNDDTKFQYSTDSVHGDLEWWTSYANDLSADISKSKTDWTVSLMGMIQQEHYILKSDVLELASEFGRDFLLNLPRVLSSLREIYRYVSIVDKIPDPDPAPVISRFSFDDQCRPCLVDHYGQLIISERDNCNPFDFKL